MSNSSDLMENDGIVSVTEGPLFDVAIMKSSLVTAQTMTTE